MPKLNNLSIDSGDRILGWKEVRHLTGLSRSGVWRLCRKNKFPHPRQLSPNRVGWLSSEIQSFIQSRPIAGLTQDEGVL